MWELIEYLDVGWMLLKLVTCYLCMRWGFVFSCWNKHSAQGEIGVWRRCKWSATSCHTCQNRLQFHLWSIRLHFKVSGLLRGKNFLQSGSNWRIYSFGKSWILFLMWNKFREADGLLVCMWNLMSRLNKQFLPFISFE